MKMQFLLDLKQNNSANIYLRIFRFIPTSELNNENNNFVTIENRDIISKFECYEKKPLNGKK